MTRVRAFLTASHPGPCLAITAMATLLTVEAAPRGFGLGRVLLVALAMLAGQVSVGWSNDACDAARDTAAGRADKPVARGEISVRALWLAAGTAVVVALALSAAISWVTALINAVIIGAGWGYNLGLKSTAWSGLMYLLGFAPLPAYASSALPGHPAPRLAVTAAAGLVGLGAHFANVLPDLARDRLTGVQGLPQRVASRLGVAGVKATALVLLLGASVLLLVAASPGRRWVAIAGLCCAAVLAVTGAVSSGRTPFRASLGIAAVDVALFAFGGEALISPGTHLGGSLASGADLGARLLGSLASVHAAAPVTAHVSSVLRR